MSASQLLFAVVLLGAWIRRVVRDFARDRGQYRRQKTLHVVAMVPGATIGLAAGEASVYLVRRVVAGQLPLDSWGGITAAAILLIAWNIWGLAGRDESHRKRALYVLPLAGLVAGWAFGRLLSTSALGATFSAAGFALILGIAGLFFRSDASESFFASTDRQLRT